MPELTLFKNRKGRVNVATPKGELIRFANGLHFTHNEEHQKYLQELADRKACGVYIDPNQPTIDTDAMTPHDMMKAKIIREYEEEKARIGRANNPAQSTPGDYVPDPGSKSVTSTQGTATGEAVKAQATAGAEGTAKAVEVPKSLNQAKSGDSGKK